MLKEGVTALAKKWLYFIPVQCPICALETCSPSAICEICERQLPWLESACECCGLPTAARLLQIGRCGRCVVEPPAFDSCHALFHYRTPVDQLIAQFKFQRRLEVGAALAKLLLSRFQQHLDSQQSGESTELLIPVPLHRKRMNQRGFNQAWELVKYVSAASGIRASNRLIERTRFTTPQTELSSADERRRNLRSAFAVTDLEFANSVTRVTIIDDVVTTAATVSAMASCLRRHGIRRVDVWCLARASV